VVKWKTKEGEEILIEQMSTEHIINCVKMIERNIDNDNKNSKPSYYMKELHYELDYDQCQQWVEFQKELKRRDK
jgi:hypothetical protein